MAGVPDMLISVCIQVVTALCDSCKSQQPGAQAAAGRGSDFETPAQAAAPSGRELARGLLSSFSAASTATPDVDAISLGDDCVILT